MTYEEKMLEIFARYRGEGMDKATLERMEAECHHEVWRHLPGKIRQSWKLKLGVSETNSGQVELHPYRLSTGEATADDLEKAFRSPFPEGPLEEPQGGMASVSMNFSGDVHADTSTVPVERKKDEEERGERNEVVQNFSSVSGSQTNQRSKGREAGGKPANTAEGTGGVGAREIEEQARAVGISLPPNSSLLGPFLEALNAAHEYKHRAEVAEAKLQQLEQALRGGG